LTAHGLFYILERTFFVSINKIIKIGISAVVCVNASTLFFIVFWLESGRIVVVSRFFPYASLLHPSRWWTSKTEFVIS
jgi:hypothetical protein